MRQEALDLSVALAMILMAVKAARSTLPKTRRASTPQSMKIDRVTQEKKRDGESAVCSSRSNAAMLISILAQA